MTHQRRWLDFCRATGADPDSASNIEFMSWVSCRVDEWVRSGRRLATDRDHALFDSWLSLYPGPGVLDGVEEIPGQLDLFGGVA